MQASLLVAFWISFFVLAYTFVGYQLIMKLITRGVRSYPVPVPQDWPAVTIVLATHNEAERIGARIDNLQAIDYESEKLAILVVDDASTDGTVAAISARHDARVRVIRNSRKRGKAACLNRAMAEVETDLVVLTDARQSFATDAIKRMMSWFGDPSVGAVSGALELPRTDCRVGEGVGIYWRLERELRRDESRWDSCIGCTGAIYALRRTLFRSIPEDTILDDVVIPMQAVLQGFRVVYDMEAVAVEPKAVIAEDEARRKRRTLSGNFQMLFRYPSWLLPWRNRLWWQLISHKYLRIFAPLFMLVMLVANIGIAHPVFRLILFAQTAFYALGILGLMLPLRNFRFTSIPAGFLFLNFASLRGGWDYLRRSYREGW